MKIEWLLIGLFGALFTMWFIARRRSRATDRIVGWARVSLLGRVEYVGAVQEVTHGGQTWLHVLTIDGSAIETQPGVVYKIERLSWSSLTDEAVRVMDRRAREEKILRDQRDHARDAVDERDARIDNLREALEGVRHGLAELNIGPGPTVNVIMQQVHEALENDAAEDCPF